MGVSGGGKAVSGVWLLETERSVKRNVCATDVRVNRHFEGELWAGGLLRHSVGGAKACKRHQRMSVFMYSWGPQLERSLPSWTVFGLLGAGVLIAAQTWSGV